MDPTAGFAAGSWIVLVTVRESHMNMDAWRDLP